MKTSAILAGQVLALALLSSVTWGVCVQTGASQADTDLWNTHGCWQEYFLWQYRAYDMNGNDWNNRGWNDACNSSLEYPKHWNAAYLVTYGLLDNNDQSFHGTADYRAAAEARGSNFHDHFVHKIKDDDGVFGSFDPPDNLFTSCPLYDPSATNSNPASRAGDFMHESWHGWMRKYNYNNGSQGGHRPCNNNPDGTCTLGACTVNGCDYFYFHGVSKYVFGAMWENDGTANRFHSPNQVQVEFLCDVSDQPQPWVPASVRLRAAADANARSAARFINGPGYTCGSFRPW